jgi:hypothetical protein
MKFLAAFESICAGRRVRREVWPAVVYAEFMKVDEEDRLMIFDTDDNKMHPWQISRSDVEATDWVAAIPATPAPQPRPRLAPKAVPSPPPPPVPEAELPPTPTPTDEP